MFYSNEFIKKILDNTNIVDVVSEYTHLVKRGNYLAGICPFHKETTPSFYINSKHQKYYCYGCGASGNVINFVMRIQKCSFCEAVEYLANRNGITMEKKKKFINIIDETEKREKIIAINRDAARFYYFQLHKVENNLGLNYFKEKRKLSDETLTKFGLGMSGHFGSSLYTFLKTKGYSDEDIMSSGLISFGEVFVDGEKKAQYYDKFWDRVMYPIMDVDNKVIGFGGRVLGDEKPKYLNSPETYAFDKSKNLYGMNLARYSRKPYIICCEGYMDVIAMHQAGFTNAVASLGTALTKQQVDIIATMTNNVYLAYDSDLPGIKAALKAYKLCGDAGLNIKVISMAPYKDPDEFIKNLGCEAFEERIQNAENGFNFVVRHLKDVSENEMEYEDTLCDMLLSRL